jgi:hypothetical protein
MPTASNEEHLRVRERDLMGLQGQDMVPAGPDHRADTIAALIAFGTAALARNEMPAAIRAYRHALELSPNHREGRIRLAHALKLSGDFVAAGELLDALIADDPNDAIVHKEFGRLYFAQHDYARARASFLDAVVRNANDADTYHWLANIETITGNRAAALEQYARAVALKPLMRVPASVAPPDFRALLLFAPGTANTPPDTLVGQARYERCFLLLVPGVSYDVERLRENAHVVVNLISDVDVARDVLQIAQSLVERIGLPVINRPATIMQTDRATVAATLGGLPLCHVPRVERWPPADRTDHADRIGAAFPLLLRVAGTHNGDHFERIENVTERNAFIAAHPSADFYATEFIDYRSPDGYFRKYRFFFSGDEILPYHLAIGDHWKVHHAKTDMANHPWMQHEEAAFLADPTAVFKPAQMQALHAIRTAIDLDFFGIDCALGADGRIVVFEVNASMLVHNTYGPFTYKAAAVERIKSAFDALLARTVTRARTAIPDSMAGAK